MKELKLYGIGELLLQDITKIAINNPDQTCLLELNRPTLFPVSRRILVTAKHGLSLEKIFKIIGIYNIILINKTPGVFSFVGKSNKGLFLECNITKVKGLNIKDACAQALLSFIKQIELAKENEKNAVFNKITHTDVNMNHGNNINPPI